MSDPATSGEETARSRRVPAGPWLDAMDRDGDRRCWIADDPDRPRPDRRRAGPRRPATTPATRPGPTRRPAPARDDPCDPARDDPDDPCDPGDPTTPATPRKAAWIGG